MSGVDAPSFLAACDPRPEGHGFYRRRAQHDTLRGG
jgi:hypothetical protein